MDDNTLYWEGSDRIIVRRGPLSARRPSPRLVPRGSPCTILPTMSPPSPARTPLLDAHRIVVKLGTSVITGDDGGFAMGRLYALIEQMARLHGQGKELVLVTSGAVGMGVRELGLAERPTSLGLRQACAAVGQGQLIGLYSRAFADLGVKVAQVLLTQEDLADRDRALCVRTTLMRLLELRVLPILNENDSVSVRELIEYDRTERPEAADSHDSPLGFGDNDGLSARVAVTLGTDVLVLLTSVAGLYAADPRTHPDATPIGEVDRMDDALLAAASGPSSGGTGGMASKLQAARHAADAGTTVLIASGAVPDVLPRLLAGEALGTRVNPAERRSDRRRGIAFASPRQGAVVVNAGALEALAERKASLLPIGVVSVEGEFAKGDVVEIRDGSGRVHGRGLVNYDASQCRAVAGRHSGEIAAILGWQGYDALITRDHLELGER